MISIPTLKKFSEYKYLIHVSYWLFIVLFFGYFWGSIYHNFSTTLTNELVLLPAKMAATYIYVYLTIPLLLLKRKYLLFILISLSSLIIFGIIQRILIYYILTPLNPVYDPTLPLFDRYQIMHLIIDINTVTVIPIGARIAQAWYKSLMETQELERAKLEAELNFLKNQIQPHFLFNTLNNLYGLIVAKSDKAESLLLKLSEMLRYMLYQTNVDAIDLSEEIEHTKNYIEIEQLRYGDKVDICFNVYGSLEGKKIAPLILLPFVENCFKHGVAKATEPAWIRIDISLSNQYIQAIIENSIPLNNTKTLIPNSGIGLQNVKRRLDIIYKEQNELKIHATKDVYTVQLKLMR